MAPICEPIYLVRNGPLTLISFFLPQKQSELDFDPVNWFKKSAYIRGKRKKYEIGPLMTNICYSFQQ